MPDVFSKRKRSAVMSAIRSRGNAATELRLLALFRAHRLTGWRRGATLRRKGEGPRLKAFRVNPDFVFRAHRLAVFVDGCFWHGCPLHATQPKQNAQFWREKIARNRARDRLVTRTLRTLGWRVLRIWEHELKPKNEPRLLARLRRALAQINVLTTTLTKHPVSARLPALFVQHLGDPWSINS
jgi:DNA mismatch endonuclease (patch repair protein)